MLELSKLLHHPDKDEIISQLINGTSPKDVAKWLKVKYNKSNQANLRLSASLLKEFLDKYGDVYNNFEKNFVEQNSGVLNEKISESLLNNKTYRERLAEVADQKIDIQKSMHDAVHLIQQRLEQVFDKIQQNPETLKNDYVFKNLMEMWMNALEKYDKLVNNRPDQIIQHNISLQMIEEHTMIFQDAIRETLMEMDLEMASKFMEIFTKKLNRLKDPNSSNISEKYKHQDKLLEANNFTQSLVSTAVINSSFEETTENNSE